MEWKEWACRRRGRGRGENETKMENAATAGRILWKLRKFELFSGKQSLPHP
jgi:hypothetical protein